MTFLQTIADNPTLLLIPIIAGVVGWGTNVVAVKMMFYPTRFVGWRPPIGWQGIVPANALRLARVGLQIITRRLLDIAELFDDRDAASIVARHRADFDARVEAFIEQAAPEIAAPVWDALGPQARRQIASRIAAVVGEAAEGVLREARTRVRELLQTDDMVLDIVARRPALMSRIFLEVGASEFRFIERSGLVFGTPLGIVQLAVWVIYPAWWILPLFGLVVGWITNWIAIKLVFEPKQPVRVGPWTLQGLFHRRQREVATRFADLITQEVFSDDNLFERLRRPEARRILVELTRRQVDTALDRLRKDPVLGPVLSMLPTEQIEPRLLEAIEEELFRPGGVLHTFASKSEDIRREMVERMSRMDPVSFERVLRPAFQQDEWKLIAAGAVLGCAAGVLQVVYLFGDMVL